MKTRKSRKILSALALRALLCVFAAVMALVVVGCDNPSGGSNGGAVDKTALAAAIVMANSAKDGVFTSEDGADVTTDKQWVTQAVKDVFTAAIATAQGVHDNAAATQAQADSAKTTLDAAVGIFNDAKSDGTKLGAISLDVTGTHIFETAAAKTVTVTNNTEDALTLSIALSGTNEDSFELSKTAISSITAGETDTFTVKPVANLAEGTYTATVTISDGNEISAGFNVTFYGRRRRGANPGGINYTR
jgi:hypothetical protein